jgi:hypothetical protein
MKTFVVSALTLLLLVTPYNFAQTSRPLSNQSRNQRWQIYSPPDNSFSVESPVPLQIESEGERQEGISFYVACLSSPIARNFGIVVIDGNHAEWSPETSENRTDGLWFLIGGDNAEPTRETVVRANGLTGKEYVYSRESRNGFFARGQIFDAGERIYVIVFASSAAEDLTSSDAERFFASFRPRVRR